MIIYACLFVCPYLFTLLLLFVCGGQLSTCSHHTTKTTVLACFLCRSLLRRDPVYHNLSLIENPVLFFIPALVLSARLPSYHFPGTIEGFISLLRDWIDIQRASVFVLNPPSGQDLPFARLSFVNKKVFLIDSPGGVAEKHLQSPVSSHSVQ